MNGFIYMQNLFVATQIFDKDCYLFKFDLKAGYHFIEVFLGILAPGSSDFFQFCVLSFRLDFHLLFLSSPLVENLRPFVSPWRPLQGVCPAPRSFGI